MRPSRIIVALCIAGSLAVAFLAACGGGGGGGSTASTPVVSAGLVSGTGSIIVNGIEYDTATARVYIDNVLQANDNGLKLGQYVKVTGALTGGNRGVATEIRLSAEDRGTASGALAGSATFTLLGQTITVTPATIFEDTTATLADLTPLNGQFVEVHGTITGPGSIRATRIEVRNPAGMLDELKGTVSNLSSASAPGSFSIGSQAVSFSASTRISPAGATLDNGVFVEVRGTLSVGTLVASEIEIDDLARETEGSRVEVDGVVSALDNTGKRFTLSGPFGSMPVSFAGLPGTGLANGAVVEAEGMVSSGVLVASEIRVENETEVSNPVKLTMLVDNVTVASPTSGTVGVAGLIRVNVSAATVFEGATGIADLSAKVLAAQGANSDVRVEIVGSKAGLLAVEAARVSVLSPSGEQFLQAPLESHDTTANPTTLVILGCTLDTTAVANFRNAAGNPITRAAFFGQLTDNVSIVKIASTQPATQTSPTMLVLPAATQIEIEPLH